MTPAASAASPGIAGLRILLVEDEMLVAMMLEDMLADLGCRVVGPASRVAKAIRLAEQEPLDGAVLDVNIAGEAVYPVADALTARKVPFVFATGYGAHGLRPPYSRVPTLQKPFRQTDLERIIRTGILRGRA